MSYKHALFPKSSLSNCSHYAAHDHFLKVVKPTGYIFIELGKRQCSKKQYTYVLSLVHFKIKYMDACIRWEKVCMFSLIMSQTESVEMLHRIAVHSSSFIIAIQEMF